MHKVSPQKILTTSLSKHGQNFAFFKTKRALKTANWKKVTVGPKIDNQFSMGNIKNEYTFNICPRVSKNN